MSDTIVWISGASSGIGAALAAAVPFDGARVIDISRSGDGPAGEHVPADLADPSAWAAVESHFIAALGNFTGSRAVFFHCAGVLAPVGFAGEVDSAAYRANVVLNSAAPQALGHAFLKATRDFDGRSDLVLLTSGAAQRPYEGWSSYGAGKAAVDQWVRSVGAEQEARGGRCRVLAVAPGVVATAMQDQIRKVDPRDFPAVSKFIELHATGALRSPEDAARDLWGLLDRDFPNGSVLDVRRLTA
ncbi:MAG TPA: SDR family NAD(P)-dependent oxidoreductase [Egibacteraceae bacterium]|nr:SDR family NAD(P)-dependent oxidoreductase [Egibacteraceae bacterium]